MRKSLIALVTLFAVTIQEPQRAQAGAFATSTTTWAPTNASARPSPVSASTPEFGDAASGS